MFTVKRVLFFNFIFLFISVSAFAYRPFTTEDAGVSDLKEMAIETGWEIVGAGNLYTNSLCHAFIVGLGKAELKFEVPYTLNGTNAGLDEIVIAFKMLVLGKNEKKGLLTLKANLSMPDANYELTAIGTKSFGCFTGHLQVGWTHETPFNINGMFFGAAADFAVLKWLSLIAEVSGNYSPGNIDVNFLGGFLISPKDFISIDVAAGTGIFPFAADWKVSLGTTLHF